jgi:hypothetical protein
MTIDYCLQCHSLSARGSDPTDIGGAHTYVSRESSAVDGPTASPCVDRERPGSGHLYLSGPGLLELAANTACSNRQSSIKRDPGYEIASGGFTHSGSAEGCENNLSLLVLLYISPCLGLGVASLVDDPRSP